MFQRVEHDRLEQMPIFKLVISVSYVSAIYEIMPVNAAGDAECRDWFSQVPQEYIQAIALLEAIAPVNKLGSRDFTLWALY